MNKYKIFFEIYGKKMVAEIESSSKYEAEYDLREEKLIVHEVRLVEGIEPTKKNYDSDVGLDNLKSMFGIK